MLWGLTRISDFQGVGRFTKNQYKVGLGQFADLMGKRVGKKDGEIFEKECWDLNAHYYSQNNPKVTTNYHEKKCLLVNTKNTKHSSEEVVTITYTLEMLLPLFKVC